MDIELTGDEHLRALAALEATVGNDDDALAVLAAAIGERPLPELLAAYGQHTLHRILIAAFGIDATMDHDETGRLVTEINSDPMARMLFVLTDALHNQAALAGGDPITAKLIAGSILLAIHAFTDADNQDALTLQCTPSAGIRWGSGNPTASLPHQRSVGGSSRAGQRPPETTTPRPNQ